jgi:hypothetical protein
MKAETTRRPLRPACASAFRMKWTRQRCQVAFNTLAIAALMPRVRRRSPASRRAGLGVRACARTPSKCLGFRRADVHPEHLAPAVAVDADRDDHRHRHDAAVLAHLHVGGVFDGSTRDAMQQAVRDALIAFMAEGCPEGRY